MFKKSLLDFVSPKVKLHNKNWHNHGCPHISLPLCTYLTAFCIFPFEITFLIHRPINVLQIRASQSDSLHDQSHRKNLLMRDRWKLVTPQSNLKILLNLFSRFQMIRYIHSPFYKHLGSCKKLHYKKFRIHCKPGPCNDSCTHILTGKTCLNYRENL